MADTIDIIVTTNPIDIITNESPIEIVNQPLYVDVAGVGGFYNLPPASNSSLGGIIAGNNISVDINGVASVAYPNNVAYVTNGDQPFITNLGELQYARSAVFEGTIPSNNALQGVACLNGIFVAVGNFGTIIRSTNGQTWVAVTGQTTRGLNAISVSDVVFIAVGQNGTIITSNDGQIWATQASGFTSLLTGVHYANNLFVVVGQGGRILTSTDSFNWTNRTNVATGNFTSVTYGGGQWAATNTDGNIYTSPDAIGWTPRAISPVTSLNSIIHDGNQFLAVGAGRLFYSTDGITWSNRTIPTVAASDIIFGGGRYLIGDSSRTMVYSSTDAINWTGYNSTIAVNEVFYCGNYYFATGTQRGIVASVDTTRWFGPSPYMGGGFGLSSLNPANIVGEISFARTSATVTANAQPNITSVGSLTNLTVAGNIGASNIAGNIGALSIINTGIANLGPIGNIKVSGGTAGQAITTDGFGNLSFATIMGGGGTGVLGGANTQIQFNDAGVFGGNTSLTFRKDLGQLTVPSISCNTASLGAVSNVSIGGGTAGQVLQTNGGGGLSWVNQTGEYNLPAATTTTLGGIIPSATQFNIDSNGLTTVTGVVPLANSVVGNSQPNITSVGTIANLTATNVNLMRFKETVVSGTVSGIITPDISQGTIFRYTLNGNITINSLLNAVAGTSATIILTQDATGFRTLSSTFLFSNGDEILSTGPNARDILFVFFDGVNYFASLSKGYI